MKPTALVIGDLMLDRTVTGEMNRVSAEAPAPVVKKTGVVNTLGGAGNVARNIVALGHPVLLMGVVGDDNNAAEIQRLAADGNIPLFTAKSQRSPTIVKERITCDGKMLARVDTESVDTSNTEGLLVGLQAIDEVAESVKVIVVADYDKGAMTAQVVERLRNISSTYGIPIFVDARPSKMHLYHNVSLIKPNMREALEMLSNDVNMLLSDTEQRAYCAAELLLKMFNSGSVVVTDGERGCAYTDPAAGNRVSGYAAFGPHDVDSVRDICGAGDTVMASLAVGCLEGKSLAFSALFGMQAAGYVVQYSGMHAAERDAVDEFIYRYSNEYKKLMTEEKALSFIARRRRMDPQTRIVFTNGCFDGFHAGHLETLRFAKLKGDVLVVAYNDDESLRELKGSDRPHVPDSYRSSHLALQSPVDAVFRFDGDVERLVRLIKPEVLVKGGDSAVATIAGADTVAKYGGRVELCPVDNFYVTVDRNRKFNIPDDESPVISENSA